MGNPSDAKTGLAVPDELLDQSVSLKTILYRDEAGIMPGNELLDATGIHGICEAYIHGWSQKDIADELGIHISVLKLWETRLEPEDRKLLIESKDSALEEMQQKTLRVMFKIARESALIVPDGLDEDERQEWMLQNLEENSALADLGAKRMGVYNILLASVRNTMLKNQKNAEKQDDKLAGDTFINQIVVSNEWLDALPKDK